MNDLNITPAPDTRSLPARLAAVMLQLNRLSKEGFNQQFKYDYVRDGDVLDTLRPMLAAQGVFIFVSMDSVEQLERRTTQDKPTLHTIAHFTFTLMDENGQKMSSSWVGEAQDTADKGISKAATYAQKTWLLKTFMLSTGDTDETDTSKKSGGKTSGKNKTTSSTGQASGRPTQPPGSSAGSDSSPLSTSSGQPWFTNTGQVAEVKEALNLTPSAAAKSIGKEITDFNSARELIAAYHMGMRPAQPVGSAVSASAH